MGLINMIRNSMRNFLDIRPAMDNTITIQEPFTYQSNVQKNRLWYRGNSSELNQFYKNYTNGIDDTINTMFWSQVPSNGLQIRKIHAPIPSMIIDKIADIVVSDMEDIDLGKANTAVKDNWDKVEDENNFKQLIKQAIINTDIDGDGAFKISIDPDISQYPIIEYFSGIDVEYNYQRGRIVEIIFKSCNDDKTMLKEIYGMGYIRYELYDENGKEIDIEKNPDYQPITWDKKIMLAIPMMFTKSPIFCGRGKSLLDDKIDNFDSFDETISQWTDAIRLGRITKYIPEDMIPTDNETGMKSFAPNPFDNQFIKTESITGMDGEKNSKIDVVQPTINSDIYIQKYTTDLDLCLQGIISPSTLGIDVKKLDNAESQREKEKTTQYSRQMRVDVLQKALPKLVITVLQAIDIYNKRTVEDYECSITWGEYANPSYEARVETVGKAMTYGIISIEKAVEEQWGDDMTDAEKAKEVQLIKEQKGLMTTDFDMTPPDTELTQDDETPTNTETNNNEPSNEGE